MRLDLPGVNGANPLGFLSSLGILRLASRYNPSARLSFRDDGSYCAALEGIETNLAAMVANDAQAGGETRPWWLAYEKQEKKGAKVVADLKAPPVAFAHFMAKSIESWLRGDPEAAEYAAAFGTSVAVDGKGNTKPTAFHFTAANQQFLGTVDVIRGAVTEAWAQRSLFDGQASESGPNLRWDPAAERNWALMAENPTQEGTRVDAPLEWLAFRGLALLPTCPHGARVLTTAVTGRGDDMAFTWPLWSIPASLASVRTILGLPMNSMSRDRAARGIVAVCVSAIRRTAQGFGNFGPATVAP